MKYLLIPLLALNTQIALADNCQDFYAKTKGICSQILSGKEAKASCSMALQQVKTRADIKKGGRAYTKKPGFDEATCGAYIKSLERAEADGKTHGGNVIWGELCIQYVAHLKKKCVDLLDSALPDVQDCASKMRGFESQIQSVVVMVANGDGNQTAGDKLEMACGMSMRMSGIGFNSSDEKKEVVKAPVAKKKEVSL